MDELISRKVLKRWLEMNKANANPLDYNTKATYAECIAMVDSMETVNVEPVRHGRWIERNGIFKDDVIKVDHLECSECGKTQRRYRDTPYCPNCGAKMD